ncbi:MAG: hypothetical protein K2F59_01575 [Eubacteriales bacterium]|nr:hypothetical protein [Eubacteriales bacterium]
MESWISPLREDLCRYIGQTVTIFTTSGGCSGAGFTGVLVSVSECAVRLLVSAGEAPACSIGSNCSCSPCGNNSYNYNYYGGNPLGAIAVIPTNSIAAFTHNAI